MTAPAVRRADFLMALACATDLGNGPLPRFCFYSRIGVSRFA